jgi:hypothetical protein
MTMGDLILFLVLVVGPWLFHGFLVLLVAAFLNDLRR